jgi:hypothetical protein
MQSGHIFAFIKSKNTNSIMTKDNRSRHSYALTEKAFNILDEMKESMGINKDKLVSFSIEFTDLNKDTFTDFIKDKMLESFKKIEKK